MKYRARAKLEQDLDLRELLAMRKKAKEYLFYIAKENGISEPEKLLKYSRKDKLKEKLIEIFKEKDTNKHEVWVDELDKKYVEQYPELKEILEREIREEEDYFKNKKAQQIDSKADIFADAFLTFKEDLGMKIGAFFFSDFSLLADWSKADELAKLAEFSATRDDIREFAGKYRSRAKDVIQAKKILKREKQR